MKMKQATKKAVLAVLLFLIAAGSAFALGVVPSRKEVIYEPGKTVSIKLKIMNRDGAERRVLLYPLGELDKYIAVTPQIVSFKEGETEKVVSYYLTMPDEVAKEGTISTDIVIAEAREELKSQSTVISATLSVTHTLTMVVPYSSKYAEIELFAGRFEPSKEGFFSVKVKNLGKEDITGAKIVIDITGPLGNKLSQLVGREFSIESKKELIENINWKPVIPPGRYLAKAHLLYDGNAANDTKGFSVGEPTLTVDSISAEKFALGGIAKLDIIVSNNWNTPVEGVFAKTSVIAESGKKLAEFKTPEETVPAFGVQALESYWDTSKAVPGKYEFDVELFYLGTSKLFSFDIFVEDNKLTAAPSGRVVSQGDQKPPVSRDTLILLLLLIVLSMNAYLIIKMKRGRVQQ